MTAGRVHGLADCCTTLIRGIRANRLAGKRMSDEPQNLTRRESVRDRVQDGQALAVTEAIYLVSRLAKQLSELHDGGRLHLNVCLQGITCDDDGQPSLIEPLPNRKCGRSNRDAAH